MKKIAENVYRIDSVEKTGHAIVTVGDDGKLSACISGLLEQSDLSHLLNWAANLTSDSRPKEAPARVYMVRTYTGIEGRLFASHKDAVKWAQTQVFGDAFWTADETGPVTIIVHEEKITARILEVEVS